MPRLTATEAPPETPTVQFVYSVALDLMNSMYFTHLVTTSDGVEGWPVEVRKQMAPDLLAELDFLYSYPKGQPGVMGQLGDVLFAHPEAWESVESLLRFVRELPLGIGSSEAEPGVQGLAFYVYCDITTVGDRRQPSFDPRDELRSELEKNHEDTNAVLVLYDHPEQLRERMARLIERFHEEHYKAELPNRQSCLERSVAAHNGSTREQAVESIRKILGRPKMCLEDVCPGPFDGLVFAPSVDMGPYASCADLEGPRAVHGMFYPCEAEFMGFEDPDAGDTQRMARIYKALSDQQRLRILHMLRDRELYAQEIVDRMSLHQSVVSRHLSFLRAVGLVTIRKHNNMKFFSLNPEITEQLSKTLDLFAGAVKGRQTDEFLRP